ncbi:iron ABC transporter permease [Halomonas campisalis]|uniref:Iron ABC transporter permease n=1 Tax=Billgrantia campisalis TaxID=74661 RepID=A0ABS9PAJ4_9GAMM|nr:iron ABC transporter permease [Halomonas campisalis]MCG6658804.1 iron ABC transporter permease [Halomonas campisalis]MDR5864767.1 iron ABC transporter permease [Halomonas campisalis]
MIAAVLRKSAWRPTASRQALILAALAAVTLSLMLAELMLGPVPIGGTRLWAALIGQGEPLDASILWQIRLPRLTLGLAVGMALALSGTALQGMLRNPLADPGLIGITAGASIGAVSAIVLGGLVAPELPALAQGALLPLAAFLGSTIAMACVFTLSRRGGETSVALLILIGIAINTIAGALLGVLVYVADDQALRDLTFWSMGGLGHTGWPVVWMALGITLAVTPVFWFQARGLDLFQLGERQAFHAGLDVERSKRRLALAAALCVGAVTAAAGPIGFIGLVAPHLARLLIGHGHRWVLPAAALLGISLVLAADLAVRLTIPPQEPPIGIATSLIGGPFFLWLLTRRSRSLSHA